VPPTVEEVGVNEGDDTLGEVGCLECDRCREREQVSRRTVTLDSQYPDYGGHPTDYWLANAGRKLD